MSSAAASTAYARRANFFIAAESAGVIAAPQSAPSDVVGGLAMRRSYKRGGPGEIIVGSLKAGNIASVIRRG